MFFEILLRSFLFCVLLLPEFSCFFLFLIQRGFYVIVFEKENSTAVAPVSWVKEVKGVRAHIQAHT